MLSSEDKLNRRPTVDAQLAHECTAGILFREVVQGPTYFFMGLQYYVQERC